MSPLSHETGYFERMYAGSPDPWGFDRRWYERRKFDVTMALLPRPRYRRAVEPGCANGSLTVRLAERVDELVAFDHLAEPVARASARLAPYPHVTVLRETFPTFLPLGTGDLAVWSEIAYYLTAEGRRVAEARLSDWLEVGGDLVSVHWIGETDYPMKGESVAEWLGELPWLEQLVDHRDEEFAAQVWRRR